MILQRKTKTTLLLLFESEGNFKTRNFGAYISNTEITEFLTPQFLLNAAITMTL